MDKEEEVNRFKDLLSRRPTNDYLQEWTESIKRPSEEKVFPPLQSFVVFRLGKEWLAIKTHFFKSVIQKQSLHKIPHIKKNLIIGLLNLEGELVLCADLSVLLDIQTDHFKNPLSVAQDRMLVIIYENLIWVFPVEEVKGILLLNPNLFQNIPLNVKESNVNFLKGIINYGEKNIGILDEELLFQNLKRELQK